VDPQNCPREQNLLKRERTRPQENFFDLTAQAGAIPKPGRISKAFQYSGVKKLLGLLVRGHRGYLGSGKSPTQLVKVSPYPQTCSGGRRGHIVRQPIQGEIITGVPACKEGIEERQNKKNH